MKIGAPTKAKITKLLKGFGLEGAAASDASAEICDLIIGDIAEPIKGYEPQVVEQLLHSMLEVIFDGRRALDFGGHSIPESVLKRIQVAVDTGKMHTVRF